MRTLSAVALLLSWFGVASAEDATAQLVTVRVAGQGTATVRPPYIEGTPIRYELLVANTGAAALRTNLIVEVASRDARTRTLYTKAFVDVPARSSKFVAFAGPGLSADGCRAQPPMYLRLENSAAAEKTLRVEPNCDFEVAWSAPFVATPRRTSLSGLQLIPTDVNRSRTWFRCNTGLALEARIQNDTTHDDEIDIRLSGPTRPLTSSPRAVVRAGTTSTVRFGWFDAGFVGIAQQVKVSLGGPSDRIAQPPGFEIKRKCFPKATLVDGQAAPSIPKPIVVPSFGLAIASASYGRNCNLALPQADITSHVAARCRTARGTCDYEMTWAPWGGRDPSPSLCKKYIDISYQCGWTGPVKTRRALHEKTPQTVTLSCAQGTP